MLGALIKIVITAIFLNWLINVVSRLNSINTIHNHSPGLCHFVEGAENGSEDIEILSNGLCFITTGLKFLESQVKQNCKLLLMDLNYPKNKPIELKILGDFDSVSFRPHGISSWVDKSTGTITLFVINHSPAGDRVEVFRFDVKEYALEHIKSISDENMYALNDLVVVNAAAFYFCNDGFFSSRYRLLNLIFGFGGPFPLASIGYYNGRKSILVQEWTQMSNGINISPDKKYLYVASPSTKALQIYDIKKDKSLNLNQTVPLYSVIDNINVDHMTGDLWIGSHPLPYQLFYRMLFNPSYPSSSQVFKLTMNGPTNVIAVTEVYANDGTDLSSCSVAAYFKNNLLIGSVDHRLLYCPVKMFS